MISPSRNAARVYASISRVASWSFLACPCRSSSPRARIRSATISSSIPWIFSLSTASTASGGWLRTYIPWVTPSPGLKGFPLCAGMRSTSSSPFSPPSSSLGELGQPPQPVFGKPCLLTGCPGTPASPPGWRPPPAVASSPSCAAPSWSAYPPRSLPACRTASSSIGSAWSTGTSPPASPPLGCPYPP